MVLVALTVRGCGEQVPPVAGDVSKHREPAVGLVSGFGEELDTARPHPLIGGVEVVDPQEETDSSSVLAAHDRTLLITVGLRQEQPRAGARRSDHHPPLRSTIVRTSRRVLNEVELQLVDEERNRLVIVVDDQVASSTYTAPR